MDPLSDIPSASTPTAVTSDPLADIPKADTSLPDSYRESSQNNPDHVSQAQEISKRRSIDPNYALANIDAVKKADAEPDWDALKKSNPSTHKLVSDPTVMGKAWDDIKSLAGLEDHARAGRQASNLVEAALAGYQGSGTGMSIRRGLPSTTLPPNPSFPQEAVSAAAGMVSDLPEMILGGAAGAPLGPFGAGAGGFALPAAYREFVRQQYTSGNPGSAHELLKRAIGIAVPAAKQAAVGAAMVASGGGAAALGAGALLTKGAEVAGMTVAGSAVEGKLPSARDAALNAIMLTGAHVAGITWDRMGEAAKASKLRARDPQTFSDHADNVSSPAYIAAEKFDAHFGPDAEDMVKKLGIEQAYNAAKASGGDIEIPAGKYLSADMDSHREALKDDVKSDPEAKTVNQIKESAAQQKADVALTPDDPKAILRAEAYAEAGKRDAEVQRARAESRGTTGGTAGQGASGSPLPGGEESAGVHQDERLPGLLESSDGPNLKTLLAAQHYFEDAGIPFRRQSEAAKIDPERAGRIADAYEAMPHDPENPTVKAAYAALINETMDQYQIIKGMGLKIEPINPGDPNPYAEGPKQVHADVRSGHLWFFPTERTGGQDFPADNPLLAMTDEKIGDMQLTANDVFRIVHDIFGHTSEGNGFGAIGEENAWQAHMRMYSPEAAAAMTSETRGQNSWVNFHPKSKANRTTPGSVYAQQKTGLLPDWVMSEGLVPDKSELQTPREQREQATAQAVASAQQETGQNARPVQGLDPKSQAELDRMQESARKEAEKILLKPQLEELKAKNRAMIQAERERAGNEIRAQLQNDPVMKAWSLFKTSKENIWGQSADYIKGDLDDEKSLRFEAIAEFSGFSSADEMARKLVTADPSLDVEPQVKSRLDQHMAQFADLKDTEAMQAEALKAVHNEKSGELLALQQQVFQGMTQNSEINAEQAKARRADAAETWELAKMLAKDTINAKPVETAGRFRAYYTAERDAAVRVEKAQADGDFAEAARAKNEQLTNHALAAESLRVSDDMARWQRSIERQMKADPSAWKDQEHFLQAAALLKRFGFEREDYNPEQRSESLSDWTARMTEKAPDMVSIPDWLQDEGIAKDWRKLTPSQLHDLRNALANIKHVANSENTMFKIGKGIEIDALADDLHQAKAQSGFGGKIPGAGTYESGWDNVIHAKDVLKNNIVAPETFMSGLDSKAGDRYPAKGLWQDTFIESKNDAMDARGEMNADDAAKWKELHAAYTDKELREMKSKPLYIPELDPRGRFTKDNLLTIAANQGTEGNQKKLLEGRDWTQEQVDAVLGKYLDKRDWDLVQAKLDWMESRKPAMAELHKRVTGFEPTWVEGKPIQTPFGEYNGGYYPLISDPRSVARGFENMKTDATLADPPVTFKAATQQGFLKARNENARYAVSLDGDGFLRHMSDVTHDLTMREWVIDAQRLMTNKSVQGDVVDAYGMENYQGMKQWLREIAGNDVKPLRTALDGIVSDVARRTTVSQLGGKLSVMLSQIHGMTAAAAVDPDNFGRADVAAGIMNVYGKMLLNPSSFHENMKFVDDHSAYMKQAGMDADRDISEAARASYGEDTNIMQFAQKGFGLMHDMTMKPIWLQAYKVGLKLNEGNEDAATNYADKIIRQSSTGGRPSDMPALMRTPGVGKLLTMFHGFVNAQTQLMVKASGRVEGVGDLPAFAGTYMNVMVLPGAMYALFHYGLPDDRKSQQMWQKAMIRSASPLSMVPIVSTLQDWAIDRGLGIPGHASLSPAGGGLDALYDLMQEATSRKAHTQKVLESATKVASYTGLPIPGRIPVLGNTFMQAYPDQFNTWLWNTVDAVHNGMTPRPSDMMKRRPARERGE